MAADLPGSDPKALWKGFDEEAEAMTLERIHVLVRRYDRRVQFGVVAMAVVLLLVGLLGGQALTKAHDALMRAWSLLFILGEVSVCALAYRVAFPPRDPAEPAGAYLRRRLQIRLDHARGKWLLMISPLLPFMVLSIYVQIAHRPGPLWARLSTLAIFIAAIAFAALRVRMRAPKLRAQVKELDELLGR